MKKRTKIALTAAVLLLVCGIGLCTAAFAVGAAAAGSMKKCRNFRACRIFRKKFWKIFRTLSEISVE